MEHLLKMMGWLLIFGIIIEVIVFLTVHSSVIILKSKKCFFIGGLQWFYFLTIHHIRPKQDYAAFIKPISILARMFQGFPYNISRVKNIDVQCLSLLILNYLAAQEISEIPAYMAKFFRNFVNN
eukprot:485946_1